MKSASVVLLVTISMAFALGGVACVAPTDTQGGVEATVRAIVASTEQARNLQATISAIETAQAEMKAPITATVTPPPGGGSATEPTKAPTATASPPPTLSPEPPPVTGKAPDLYVSEFALNPTTPTQGKPVAVRVGVYNKGTAPAGPFTVRWWPGENYPTPGCEWPVESLVASGGRILTCNYAGYPSWYAKLNTKVVVDTGATVAESDEANNTLTREISVSQPVAATAPDLYVSEFTLNPTTPTQGKPVAVRVGVYNKGTAPAGPFTVRWWPGENYPTPGCEWPVESLVASGGLILSCNYAGYPSWYAKLNTKVVVDTGTTVAESDEANNTLTREISVLQPAAEARLSITGVNFSMSSPIATKDPVWPKVTIKNEGGSPSAPFTVLWRPKPDAPQQSAPVNRALAPGESILVELPAYTYPICGTFSANIALSNGGASRNETIKVAPFCPPVPIAPPEPEKLYKIERRDYLGGGSKRDENFGGLCDPRYQRSRVITTFTISGPGKGECKLVGWADNDPHKCLATIHFWADMLTTVKCTISIYEIGDPPTPPPSCSCRPYGL